jgi:uncharacterized membrane protein YfcA
MLEPFPFLALAVFVVAFLYSSVGHAGASGSIAVMTLFGLPPSVIKPTALALNILVASLASFQFRRAGHFSWSLFWPFAAFSIPFAFVGGYVNLPTHVFKALVGGVLLLSAARLLLRPPPDDSVTPPPLPVALSVGAGLGLLSGLTGTGGGIFLTPLLLLMRWARTKSAAAISAVFILVNSLAGLLGNVTSTKTLPTPALPLALAALAGGAAGSYLGSARLTHVSIKRLLAVVLLIAGSKLLFTS